MIMPNSTSLIKRVSPYLTDFIKTEVFADKIDGLTLFAQPLTESFIRSGGIEF